MIYSVLYGHLNKSYVKVGDKLVYGAKVGEMGNTGEVLPMPTPKNPNDGTHLHLAVVEGKRSGTWTLASTGNGTNKPNQQQCIYFIDDDIFGGKDKTLITSGWLSYKNHYAYDIIPQNRSHYDLYWNRSFTGIVSAVGYNSGYGNYVIVQYDTSKKSTVEELAKEVISGLWGYNEDRKTRLTNAGYNYAEVQEMVNAILSPKEPPKSNEEENPNTNTSSQLKVEIERLKQELGQVKSDRQLMLTDNQLLQDKINLLEQENKRLKEDYVMLQNSSDEVEDNLIKENQVLQDKLNLFEKDKPKLIYHCEKDGTYRIKLKQNYKLYIKD